MAEALDLGVLRTALEDAGRPWEMDETSMTVLTEDERVVRLGVTPPPGEPSIEEAASAFQAGVTAPPVPAAAVGAPATFDLRNVGGKNFTTPVKDQKGCGSCVAFGSAAAMETTYKRSRNNAGLVIDLSEAHLFYCHAKSEGRTCANGWWPENALNKARDLGVTFEQFFPYTAGDQNCNLQAGWDGNIAKVTGQQNLSGNPAAMKEWISTRGSLAACFVVYQDFFSYRSGVYRNIVVNANPGGHCVEIIGYDDAQGCWICKNSWGAAWGEGGFFRIAYGQCQIESWLGPRGVLGVNLKTWRNNVRASGLWANNSDRNAWVHLTGVGWRKVAADTDTVHHAMLAQLITAKESQRPLNVLEEAEVIREIYVL